MSAMASQITNLTIVCSTVYSAADQRKHQSSASLAFVWGIHRWPVNSPHKGLVTCKNVSISCCHQATWLHDYSPGGKTTKRKISRSRETAKLGCKFHVILIYDRHTPAKFNSDRTSLEPHLVASNISKITRNTSYRSENRGPILTACLLNTKE